MDKKKTSKSQEKKPALKKGVSKNQEKKPASKKKTSKSRERKSSPRKGVSKSRGKKSALNKGASKSAEKKQKALTLAPIGEFKIYLSTDDFKEFKKKNTIWVDKSLFIKEAL